MITVAYLFSILAILFAGGFGLTLWLLPAELRHFRLAVMPTVGLATIIVVAGFLNISGLPMGSAAPLTLLLLILLDILLLLRFKRQFALKMADFRPLVFGILAVLACAWPMFYSGPTYMSFVNNDGLNYTAVSHFLQHGTYNYPPTPTVDHSTRYVVHNILVTERMGCEFLLSTMATLLGQDPKPVLMPLIFALLFLLPLSVYALVGGFLGASLSNASLASFLIALSSISGFGYLYQLLAQATGVPLTIVTIGLAGYCLRARDWKCAALAALVAVATVSAYVEISPIALGVPFVAGFCYIFARQLRLTTFLALAGFLIASALVLLTPHYAYRLVHWLFFQAAGSVGHAQSAAMFPYMLVETGPPALFGLVSVPFGSSPLSAGGFGPLLLLIVLAGVCLAVLGLGLWQQVKKRQYLIISAFALVFGLGFQLFRTLSGFGALKLTMYMQFVVLILFSAGVVWLWNHGLLWKIATAAFLAVFVSLNVIALETYAVASLGRSQGTWVEWGGISNSSALEEVKKAVDALPPDSRIVVGIIDNLPKNWLMYVLDDHSVRLVSNAEGGAQGLLEDRVPQTRFIAETDWLKAGRPKTEAEAGRAFQQRAETPLLDDTRQTYFLLWNDARQLHDFDYSGQSCSNSVWQDQMFCLVPASGVSDFIVPVAGRNRTFWYKDSDLDLRTSWFAVERNAGVFGGRAPFRWLNNSGLLMVYAPSKPFMRISLDLFPGYGQVLEASSGPFARHVSLYCNGELFDQVEVRGFTRFVSKPFRARPGASLIEIRVQEDVLPRERHPALWNKWLAYDYRMLNLGVANVRLVSGMGDAENSYPESLRFDSNGKWQDVARLTNGIYPDGWACRDVELSFRQTSGSREFVAEGNLTFPLNLPPKEDIEVRFDGKLVATRHLPRLGPFRLVVPIQPEDRHNRIVQVDLRSDRSFVPGTTPNGTDLRDLAFQLVSAGFQ